MKYESQSIDESSEDQQQKMCQLNKVETDEGAPITFTVSASGK